jgi:hypothetical protein
MNTTAAKATTPATQARPFNLDRTHTVGQYLNYDQDAKRVVVANKREADKTLYALGARIDAMSNALRALGNALSLKRAA